MTRADVLAQIEAELGRAAVQWGGASADDLRTRGAWLRLVDEHRMRAARHGEKEGADEYRHQLVVIAALAIAAIEAHDRQVAADPASR